MSISADILEAMAAAGCTTQQLIAAVRADEVRQREQAAEKREATRIRVQKHRARNKSNALPALQRVTDVTPLLPDGLEGSTPPKTLNPISPSSSLRSEDARVREEFDHEFWPAYPHKVGKADAVRAFGKARRQAPLAAMLAGLKTYIDSKPADRPWLNPATWLNGSRWNDQPAEIAPRSQGPPREPTLAEFFEEQGRRLKAEAEDDEHTIEADYRHGPVNSPPEAFPLLAATERKSH